MLDFKKQFPAILEPKSGKKIPSDKKSSKKFELFKEGIKQYLI